MTDKIQINRTGDSFDMTFIDSGRGYPISAETAKTLGDGAVPEDGERTTVFAEYDADEKVFRDVEIVEGPHEPKSVVDEMEEAGLFD